MLVSITFRAYHTACVVSTPMACIGTSDFRRVAAAAVLDPYVVARNIMAISAGSRAIATGLDVASMLEEARTHPCVPLHKPCIDDGSGRGAGSAERDLQCMRLDPGTLLGENRCGSCL